MNCRVCEDRGFVQAAPVDTVATWTGANPVPTHADRVAWEQSVIVPCWACAQAAIA